METTSFDLDTLLKKHQKNYKNKPSNLTTVAAGVQKRLQANLKTRKSSRLTIFDSIRDLSISESPVPKSNVKKSRAEQRRLQLEKWKEEKEKKKKDAAANKPKPFIIGIAHNSNKFVPPPPVRPSKSVPNTSGMVTRAQTAKYNAKQKDIPSFAPKNATFKAPLFKNPNIPVLVLPTSKKENKVNVKLNPVPQQDTGRIRASKVNFKSNNINQPMRITRASQWSVQTSSSGDFIETFQTKRKMAVQKSSSSEVDSDLNQTAKGKTSGKSINTSGISDSRKQNALSRKSFSNKEELAKETSSSSDSLKMRNKCVTSRNSLSNKDKFEVDTSSSSNSEKKQNTLSRKSFSNRDKLAAETSSSSDSEKKYPQKATTRKSISKRLSNINRLALDTSISSDSEKMYEQKVKTSRRSLREGKLHDALSSSSQSPSSSEPEKILDIIEADKTPMKPIPKSESSSEEKLRSPKNPENYSTPEKSEKVAKKISPCVTLSRGKDNARREMKKKLEQGLLDDDASDMDNVDDFRRQLASEIERITELCLTWDKVLEQTQLPDTIQESVLAAVGQARLLMSQKLQQFASLVERCARPEPGTALVTPADLQGFWDMVFMQVENVYMRFKELERVRERGWQEDQQVEVAKKPVAKPKAKRPKAKGGPSQIREMIAAARRAKKEHSDCLSTLSSDNSSESECKTFEAGFFRVTSPLKSPTTGTAPTPNRPTLLKAVLSNEANKASASKASASFAMLRASVMSKCVDCDGVSPLPQTPLTPINLLATPGRSILKSSTKNSSKKSIKVVLFDNSDDSDSANNEPTKNTKDSNFVVEVFTEKPKDVNENSERDNSEVEKVVSEDIGKENKRDNRRKSIEKRQSRLIRQEAVEHTPSPVKTRSQRRCVRTPLLDIPNEPQSEKKKRVSTETPRRSTRSRKSVPA